MAMKPQQLTPKKPYPKALQRELKILQLIHANGQISRLDLARNTGSSLASLTTIAHRLIQRKLIVEAGHCDAFAVKRVWIDLLANQTESSH